MGALARLTIGPMRNEIGIEPLRGVGSSSREKDLGMSRLAGRQHGVVARRQLLEMGFGRKAIEGRLKRGTCMRSSAASTSLGLGQ